MKRLTEMSKEELWELFPIILTKPDPRWRTWASDEISFLNQLLISVDCKLYHIGSTSINGIWAKPIIDIIIAVKSISLFIFVRQILIDTGYICMSQISDRMGFNKWYTSSGFADKVYHIHLRQWNDIDEVYFRDYLNLYPDVAKEYEALKLSLWKEFEHDRDGYTEAKTSFVTHYTKLAKDLFRKY